MAIGLLGFEGPSCLFIGDELDKGRLTKGGRRVRTASPYPEPSPFAQAGFQGLRHNCDYAVSYCRRG